MRLGKDENMLFLGSKDMNVYLIDIAKGKLCVVYEGHWSKPLNLNNLKTASQVSTPSRIKMF